MAYVGRGRRRRRLHHETGRSRRPLGAMGPCLHLNNRCLYNAINPQQLYHTSWITSPDRRITVTLHVRHGGAIHQLLERSLYSLLSLKTTSKLRIMGGIHRWPVASTH